MKRESLISFGAAAIIVAGVVSCSNMDETSSETTKQTQTTTAAATTSSSPATVSVDGQVQPVNDSVVCETLDGKFSIAIGEPITGVIVGLEPDASVVHGVATKDGNSYNVSGIATGSDDANPSQQVSNPFEIDVTCP